MFVVVLWLRLRKTSHDVEGARAGGRPESLRRSRLFFGVCFAYLWFLGRVRRVGLFGPAIVFRASIACLPCSHRFRPRRLLLCTLAFGRSPLGHLLCRKRLVAQALTSSRAVLCAWAIVCI